MNPSTARQKSLLAGFFLHLHPRRIPEETVRFNLSFGLGGMALVLFVTLVLTGVLQALAYAPDTESAYDSIRNMYTPGNAAGFVRNIHHWSGNLLVIITALHLLRVFLTGGCNHARRINWLIGIGLFLLVLLANFSGYLLPWDQLAYWAVTIFTSMAAYVPLIGDEAVALLRGGTEVGPPTLATFFAIHVALLPVLILILLIFHFWLIRRAGGLVLKKTPAETDRPMLATVPHLIQREAAVGLCLLAALFMFSAVFDAPLGGHANPAESPNPAKAAWYFMGLQELLLHLHPTFALMIIPTVLLLAFAVIPFVDGAALSPGRWCGSSRGIWLAAMSCGAGFLLTILAVITDSLLVTSASSVNPPDWLSRGMIPLGILVGLCLLLFLALSRNNRFTRGEATMGVVMLLTGSILGLTVIGIWFRGPGMSLTWPIM
jgi:quinol-cytochrome oxidoreductase complex cytochrome b subunit